MNDNEIKTAKEFLTSKNVFHGLGVCEDNTTGRTHKIADLMEAYHKAKLSELPTEIPERPSVKDYYDEARPNLPTDEENISHFKTDTGMTFGFDSDIEVVKFLTLEKKGRYFRRYPDGELEEVVAVARASK